MTSPSKSPDSLDEILREFMWAFTVSSSAEEGKKIAKAQISRLIADSYERGYSDGFTAKNKKLWNSHKDKDERQTR